MGKIFDTATSTVEAVVDVALMTGASNAVVNKYGKGLSPKVKGGLKIALPVVGMGIKYGRRIKNAVVSSKPNVNVEINVSKKEAEEKK